MMPTTPWSRVKRTVSALHHGEGPLWKAALGTGKAVEKHIRFLSLFALFFLMSENTEERL